MVGIRSVAVIGAGMAGAAAAQQLAATGLDVLLVDKGRGVGGRMATRRLGDDLSFDHGAQYFTARDPRFIAQVEAWVAAGAAAPWEAGPGWFVGTPAMTAPARALTQGLTVLTGCTVAGLHREAGAWRLADGAGSPIADGRTFDALLVTAPAPQAAALLATAGIDLPDLTRVRYAPCWALMLAHDSPSPLTDAARRDPDPDAALSWIARNDRKPGGPTSLAPSWRMLPRAGRGAISSATPPRSRACFRPSSPGSSARRCRPSAPPRLTAGATPSSRRRSASPACGGPRWA